MPKILDLALRTWQFICALIIMSLIGNMIEQAYSGNPSSINFTMFCSVFAMVSLFFYFPAAFMGPSDSRAKITAGLDGLNFVFWLCAAIALAAKLEVHSCTNHSYLIHNEITDGARDMTKRCREAQASTAFLWFGWAAFAVSFFLSLMEAFGRGGVSSRKGSNPVMRQV